MGRLESVNLFVALTMLQTSNISQILMRHGFNYAGKDFVYSGITGGFRNSDYIYLTWAEY